MKGKIVTMKINWTKYFAICIHKIFYYIEMYIWKILSELSKDIHFSFEINSGNNEIKLLLFSWNVRKKSSSTYISIKNVNLDGFKCPKFA